MNKNHNLLSAFRNAFHGLAYVFTSERNARIHSVATLLVIIFGFFLHINTVEWIAIIFAIGFVWVSECFNTSLEKITDLASPQYNGLAKITKDTAAAGVLVASITAAVVGVLVFLPKLINFIK